VKPLVTIVGLWHDLRRFGASLLLTAALLPKHGNKPTNGFLSLQNGRNSATFAATKPKGPLSEGCEVINPTLAAFGINLMAYSKPFGGNMYCRH
jgi:hypothetical protein